MLTDMCGEIMWQFPLEWHIKSCFALGIFVIINFWNHFPIIRRGFLNIGIEIIMGNIQIKNYIGCGIKITK